MRAAFNMYSSSEPLLRRALFEDTGGMYPELITRPDIKVFLPPIGNLTVYICALYPFYAVVTRILPIMQSAPQHICMTRARSLHYVCMMNATVQMSSVQTSARANPI